MNQADKEAMLDWLIGVQTEAVQRFGTHWPGYRMMAGLINDQRKIVSQDTCEHVFEAGAETKMVLGWRTDTTCKKCGKLKSYVFEYFDGQKIEEEV